MLGDVDFSGDLHEQPFERGVIVSHFENRLGRTIELAFAERGPFRSAAVTLHARTLVEKAFSMVPAGVVGQPPDESLGYPIPISDEQPISPISGVFSGELATMQRFALQARYPSPQRLITATLEWIPRVIRFPDPDISPRTYYGRAEQSRRGDCRRGRQRSARREGEL